MKMQMWNISNIKMGDHLETWLKKTSFRKVMISLRARVMNSRCALGCFEN